MGNMGLAYDKKKAGLGNFSRFNRFEVGGNTSNKYWHNYMVGSRSRRRPFRNYFEFLGKKRL